MPRVEFSPENKVATTDYGYPKLKLALNERARILVGLEAPWSEYVHNLNKPQIINGEVQTKEVVNERTKKKSVETITDFVSKPICLGDPTILAEKGSDPAHCPMCKLAKDHPDFAKPPQRRYAMHVIHYRTKSTKDGTIELVKPFSVECEVWAFTTPIFNKLIDFQEEWGDLRKHDLLLGPCTNPLFQQFDITVAAKAAWLLDPEWKKQAWDTFQENQIPDLSIACGTPKKREWVEEDVQTILDAWAEVNAGPSSDVDVDLDADLSSLLDKDPEPEVETDGEGWAVDAGDIDLSDLDGLTADLGGGLDEFTPEATSNPSEEAVAPPKRTRAKAAPKAAPKNEVPDIEEAPAEAESDNFEDLLADL